MALTNNVKVNAWLDEVIPLLKPDAVELITGEKEQLDRLTAEAVSTGEFITLNQEKLPGCYLHRSDPNDVARVESRTFICSRKEEDAGPTNNWMDPKEMYAKLETLYDGAMKGRTMYVIPYSMSIVGSPFAKYGIEITDSIYVVISMNIMTRIGTPVLEALGTDGDFIKGLHAKADLNPENGFFGVAPGTSAKSNPNALASTAKNTLFTNVVLNKDDNTVWWEGMNKTPPTNAEDWQGRPWNGETSTEKGAHPNSRFTAPAKNCPCISPEFDNPQGVPISAIIFGGRRAKTAPLVYQSRSWQHGVFVGSIMASETTAAATGAVGVLRRDPMAMRPFCGYHMGDYWQHWLDMGEKIPNPPKIFNVNWFRTDDDGNFLWPGFGDNLRVLEWILKRCFDEVDAQETPIGYEPNPTDINLEGTDVSLETLTGLLGVDKDLWMEDVANIEEFYKDFGDKLPPALREELETLKKNLQ